MKDTVVFLDLSASTDTRVKTLDAIAEVDEFGKPFSAEVLWFRRLIGAEDSGMVFEALKNRHISYTYSDEVDALTFSFGDGAQSSGQVPVTLILEFKDYNLLALTLHEIEAFGQN